MVEQTIRTVINLNKKRQILLNFRNTLIGNFKAYLDKTQTNLYQVHPKYPKDALYLLGYEVSFINDWSEFLDKHKLIIKTVIRQPLLDFTDYDKTDFVKIENEMHNTLEIDVLGNVQTIKGNFSMNEDQMDLQELYRTILYTIAKAANIG
jgi:hypothetical protein